jgi:hypothetical protein
VPVGSRAQLIPLKLSGQLQPAFAKLFALFGFPREAGRRMAPLAAHLVEQVVPWVPTRQWVVSVPIPLRYWMVSPEELTAAIHTIIRRAIHQYIVAPAFPLPMTFNASIGVPVSRMTPSITDVP